MRGTNLGPIHTKFGCSPVMWSVYAWPFLCTALHLLKWASAQVCGSSHTDQIAGFGSCIINGSGDKCCNQVTCLCYGYTVDSSIICLISQLPSKYFSNCYFCPRIITSRTFHFSRRIIKSSFKTELKAVLLWTILLNFLSRWHSNNYNISNQVDHSQRFYKMYMIEFQVLQFYSTK